MYRQVMTRAIAERMRWKAQYEAAKALQERRPGASVTTGQAAVTARADHCASSSPIASQSVVVGLAVKGERSESRSDTKCP